MPFTRNLRPVLTIAVALGILGFGARWMYFKWSYITPSYAYVKGEVVQIGSPIDGQIVALEVRDGQHVRKGDVLVRLNDTSKKAKVAEARAEWERAKLQVDVERKIITVDRRRADVMTRRLRAEHAASAADVRLELLQTYRARQLADRTDRLGGAVAQEDHDRTHNERDVAAERLSRARAFERRAIADLSGAEVDLDGLAARTAGLALLEAAADNARAALDVAEAELELTVIRAPQDGRIARRMLQPGAAVRTGLPVVELWLDGILSVEAWVGEKELSKLKVGGPAHVTIDALGGKRFAGTIESVSFVTDMEVKDVSVTAPIGKSLAKARWVRVRIALKEHDDRLFPGLSVSVAIPR